MFCLDNRARKSNQADKTRNMKVFKRLDGMTVSYDDTPELRNAVFERVLLFFIEQKTFSGESICQMDGPQIEAPNMLGDLADDVFKFQTKYDGDE